MKRKVSLQKEIKLILVRFILVFLCGIAVEKRNKWGEDPRAQRREMRLDR